jgi:hypothetical protein
MFCAGSDLADRPMIDRTRGSREVGEDVLIRTAGMFG